MKHPASKALGNMRHSNTYSEPRHQKEVCLTTRQLHNRGKMPQVHHGYGAECHKALDVFAEREIPLSYLVLTDQRAHTGFWSHA